MHIRSGVCKICTKWEFKRHPNKGYKFIQHVQQNEPAHGVSHKTRELGKNMIVQALPTIDGGLTCRSVLTTAELYYDVEANLAAYGKLEG